MEDGLDKLFYLLISIIYAIFSYSKKQARKEPPEVSLPPDTTVPNWKDDWDEEVAMTTPAWEEAIQETPAPIHHPPTVPVQPRPPAARRQPKTERVLGRYSGWKKAAVMSEIMRPYL